MPGRDPSHSDPSPALDAITVGDPYAEPWDDARIFRQMMLSLLERLAEYGPMTDDQIARHCLKADELSALVPEPERTNNARNTCDAAVSFLDDEGDRSEYAIALEVWKQAISRARYKLDWKRLPPRCHALSKRRSEMLNAHALDKGWIQPPPSDDEQPNDGNRLWQIAPAGFDAIQNLRVSKSK